VPTSKRPITAPEVQFEGVSKEKIEKTSDISSINSRRAKVTKVNNFNADSNDTPSVLAIDKPGRYVIQDQVMHNSNKRYNSWQQI